MATSKQSKKEQELMKGVEVVDDKYVLSLNKELSLVSAGMTDAQKMFLLGKTPEQHIKTRKGRGNQNFDYVTGVYIKKVLNFVFNWNWSFEVLDEWEHPKMSDEPQTVICKGKLTVSVWKNNKEYKIVKTQYGNADVKYVKDSDPKEVVNIGDDYKAAATDALKKCASELGIASDVYGKNEFRDIKIAVTVDEEKIKADITKQRNNQPRGKAKAVK